MVDRITAKILTASDLTFFRELYLQRSNVRQKAINLNADPFVKTLYPALASGANTSKIPIVLTIYGPGEADAYTLTRAITKAGRGYKNWRLNGEFVPDPDEEPNRFRSLTAGDVAMIEFTGDPLPQAAKLILVSAADDPDLTRELKAEFVGANTMQVMSRLAVRAVADRAGAPSGHPVRWLAKNEELEADLEDAASGLDAAVRRLRRRAGRKVTAAELAAQRKAAEEIGEDGEFLAFQYLRRLQAAGRIHDLVWVSREDAIASWDFEYRLSDGSPVRVDAKSTAGGIDRLVHISSAEIAAAAESDIRYDLMRVYEIGEAGANVAVAEGVNALAARIMSVANGFPGGVLPTGFTISRGCLTWSEPEMIERPDDPEESD